MSQMDFWKTSNKTSHGGDRRKKRRKTARPIFAKQPMHVVFRSGRARGKWNLLRKARRVEQEVQRVALHHKIRVEQFTNVGNHLHFTVRAPKRHSMQAFLRVLPQAIVFLVTGTRKGKPLGRFWDPLVFTRLITKGRDERQMRDYHEKNRLEASGLDRREIDREFKKRWDYGLDAETL